MALFGSKTDFMKICKTCLSLTSAEGSENSVPLSSPNFFYFVCFTKKLNKRYLSTGLFFSFETSFHTFSTYSVLIEI